MTDYIELSVRGPQAVIPTRELVKRIQEAIGDRSEAAVRIEFPTPIQAAAFAAEFYDFVNGERHVPLHVLTAGISGHEIQSVYGTSTGGPQYIVLNMNEK